MTDQPDQDDQPDSEKPAGIIARLRAGIPVLSLGVRHARTPDIARMAHGAGFGVVWVDLEHSAMPIDAAVQIAATATDLGLAAWVRTPERDLGVIGRLLDGGATGIIAPKVESADEARAVAAACRFAPRGSRSAIAILPHFAFRRLPAAELTRRADDAIVVQILLESRKGIDNVEAIAAVDGVDLLAIGMNDLTADYGYPGAIDHPEIVDAVARVARAARAHGKLAVCGGVGDAAAFQALLDAGFAPLIFAAIDSDLIAAELSSRAAQWHARLTA